MNKLPGPDPGVMEQLNQVATTTLQRLEAGADLRGAVAFVDALFAALSHTGAFFVTVQRAAVVLARRVRRPGVAGKSIATTLRRLNRAPS